ncbi:MAG TPA: hypothetical protein VIR54_02340, partial [Vicinamibacterales bacterium]
LDDQHVPLIVDDQCACTGAEVLRGFRHGSMLVQGGSKDPPLGSRKTRLYEVERPASTTVSQRQIDDWVFGRRQHFADLRRTSGQRLQLRLHAVG